MLQRTQLILDSQTKQELQLLAIRSNRSISSLVREMVKKQLPKRSAQAKKMAGTKFLITLAQNAVAGPGDSEYDKYAYDE